MNPIVKVTVMGNTTADQLFATRYRVFVSYSHEDVDAFTTLKTSLEALDLCVLSDRNIGAGTPFTDAIKGLITHAHLFVPLITRNAQQKPWVHQETGFAMASNIPILPIVLEDAGMPSEMIAQLQAIKVRKDLSDLTKHLENTHIERLILPRPAPPVEMVQVAEWPEERTRLLAEWANRVRDLGHEGVLRQRGAFSSFCIPDADLSDDAWKRREGRDRRSDYYHHLQREERQALEWHAIRAGCRLILDPSLRFRGRGLEEVVCRLETLLDFLQTATNCRVEIALSTRAREGSLTLVGNWFIAESLIPKPGGYRQTIFSWHAPTVSRWVQRFDEQFDHLCHQRGVDISRSRESAIERITGIIAEYRKELGALPGEDDGTD